MQYIEYNKEYHLIINQIHNILAEVQVQEIDKVAKQAIDRTNLCKLLLDH